MPEDRRALREATGPVGPSESRFVAKHGASTDPPEVDPMFALARRA